MSIYINGKELATTEDFGKTFSEIVKWEGSGFDLNNFENNTVYCDKFVPANAPENIDKWAFYISLNHGHNVNTQFAIEVTEMNRIFIRHKSGANPTWGKWRLISSRTNIDELEQRITNLENKLKGK